MFIRPSVFCAAVFLAAQWQPAVLLAAQSKTARTKTDDAPVVTTAEPQTETGDEAEAPAGYLRVSDVEGVMALDIAITKFAMKDKGKPTITLVGVSHIGDAKYYKALQRVLDAHDVVLYESVMPAGVGEFRGDDDDDRIAHTKAAMSFVWSQTIAFQKREHRAPNSLAELREKIAGGDSRHDAWLAQAIIDGWGRPIVFHCDETTGEPCVLLSYGADGVKGGDGAAADILSTDPDIARPAAAYAEMADDQLQAQLATALDLDFQLDAINYDRDNWICSDMTMDQLQRAFTDRGLDFGPISSTLAGSSLPGRIVKGLLKIITLLDTMTKGAITDTLKVCLIEMLGNDQIMDQAMTQFGEGFGEVIIGERNQIVMDDLSKMLAKTDAKTIAVFYGAGHLPDFERRLHELGYEPIDTQWEQAIAVDVKRSAMPAEQLRQMRMMIRQSMQQGFSMPKRGR